MKRQWFVIALMIVAVSLYAQDTTDATAEAVIDENTVDSTEENIVSEEPLNEDTTLTETEEPSQESETNTVDEEVVQEVVEVPAEEISVTEEQLGYTVKHDDVLYASPNARFGIEGEDDLSGLKEIFISLDGGVYAPYRDPVSFSTEGPHTINYKFVDQVGNISYSQTFDVIIDATVPRVLELQLNPEPYVASGYTYVGPNTEISFKSFDDLTGVAFVEYSTNKDMGWERYTTNTTFATIGVTNTGLLNLHYTATDMVSNVSPVKTKTVFVDATPPVVDVYAPAFEKDGVRYISPKAIVGVEAFDSETQIDKIFYAVNDEEYQEYDSQIGIRLTNAGNYDIKAKAIDIVGNESAEFVYSVVVDMLAPTGNAAYISEEESQQSESEETPLGTEEQPISEESTYTDENQNIDEIDMEIVTTEEIVTDEETAVVNPSQEVPAGELAPQ